MPFAASTTSTLESSTPGRSVSTNRWAQLGFLLLALALPALQYYRITLNFFFQDDFLNLYEIADKDLWSFVLRMHGGHLLMTRNALFALFYNVFGTNEVFYFWAVYLTHLLNVVLLFLTVRDSTGSARLACFGAAAWGLLPVHAGSLGWYSVYGQVIVAACMLWILSGMARVATGKPLPRFAPLLWALLLAAAMSSFGVGIGVALVMPGVACLLVPRGRGRARVALATGIVSVATPLVYLWVQEQNRQFDGGLAPSDMAAGALLYLATYVRFLLELIGYAITCLALGTLHDPLYYPGAAAYALVAVWVAILVVIFVRGSTAVRRQILACLLLALAIYGMISAGRAAFIKPNNTPWMIRSPRFHYAGPIPVAILSCILLAQFGNVRWLGGRPKTGLLLLWMGAMFAGRYWKPQQIPIRQVWSARRETSVTLADIHKRIARAKPGATVFIPNQGFKSVGPMLYGAVQRFPGSVGLFVIYFPENVVDGHRVYFLEADPKVIEGARNSRRTAELLKSYESVGRRAPPPPTPVWRPNRRVGK